MLNRNIPSLFCYIGMRISTSIIDFVRRHENDDVNALRLKYTGKIFDEDFDLEFALIQIEARRKCKKKIPTLVENPFFIFPSLVSSEQASNEAVARFHASLIPSGASLLDLTAGLGIDDMAFAKVGIKVTSCEIDENKSLMLQHNSKILGLDKNLTVICADSMEYIKTDTHSYDVVFVDPARRDCSGKRVHALSDCQPDILSNMNIIMRHTDHLLVKSSPLLDLSLIINTVSDLYHIYVVCFRGECKEVLIEIRKNEIFTGVTAIDLNWNHTISEFNCKMPTSADSAAIKYAELPSPISYKYLYEPNAAVMKTGEWVTLQKEFPDLRKADINTHLFLSDTLYEDFPGRVLRIDAIPDKKALKHLKGVQYNVVSRNHPLTAPLLSKKFGIVPGSSQFLYAFRFKGTPLIVSASQYVNKQDSIS